MSESKKNKKLPPFSEEHRRKLKENHIGFKGKKHTEIAKTKMSESHQREKNPRWIKDRSFLLKNKRNDPEYKQWRYQIFKRDRHLCRINNKDCFGKVVAHHILPWSDFPELRYEVKNGVTLCQTHHPKKRVDEKRLAPFLQN